jgi:hypothetical protein
LLEWKEDDMSSTINPTCPLCGLRYTDRPLLELHIREDHVQRDHAQEAPHDEPGATRPPQQAPPSPGRPARAPTAWRAAATALTRAIRYIDREMMRASRLMFPYRVPPARPQAPSAAGHEAPAGNQAAAARRERDHQAA